MCRAVRNPRGVLAEMGLQLPADVAVKVHDSTADSRWAEMWACGEGGKSSGRGSDCRLGFLGRAGNEMGLQLPADVAVKVHDSTADSRWAGMWAFRVGSRQVRGVLLFILRSEAATSVRLHHTALLCMIALFMSDSSHTPSPLPCFPPVLLHPLVVVGNWCFQSRP